VSARVVLCYGDSNTLGWDATTGSRFPQEVRWPGLLAAKLGDGWRVVEDGVGGRMTIYDDPVLAGVNGLRGLEPALRANAPLDLVVLFLGTNDFKPQLGLAAGAVADGVRALVEHVLASDTGPGGGAPAVLVLGLPRLGRHHGFSAAEWARLPALLHALTRELGVGFLDLSEVTAYADADGYHLDAGGHAAVAAAVAHAIKGAR